MKFNFSIAVLILALSGCQSTNPGDAVTMRYQLPRTDASISILTTLKECSSTSLTVDQKIAISAEAGAQTQVYSIDGSKLASNRATRDIKIRTYDNGVLKSVSAETTDKTPAIVTNVLKTATSVASMALTSSGTSICNNKTKEALAILRTRKVYIAATKNALNIVEGKINALANENDLDNSQLEQLQILIEKREHLKELVNDYAKEVATSKTEVLSMRVNLSLKISDPDATNVQLDALSDEYAKSIWNQWIRNRESETIPTDYVSRNDANAEAVEKISRISYSTDALTVPSLPKPNDKCSAMAITAPVADPYSLTVSISTGDAGKPNIGNSVLPIAQFNQGKKICLDTKFGESRTVGIGWDKFGRATSFDWKSSARAEAVTGAAADYAERIDTLATKIEGASSLDELKSELEYLKTQKALNELRACEAIIDAGGYDCSPEDEEAS